ncbi:MAG: SlyX family protein [Betaproteobacteria bacterium]|nr:SlyX family protein [Betaproteobacteria bacterium]MDH4189959.1 SlyX family protein [Betaproteobacteria bacterium]
MTNAETIEPRLVEIETKLSLAEDLLEAMNRTVFRQQQEIEQLQRDLRALRGQLQPDDGLPVSREIPHETPPHY